MAIKIVTGRKGSAHVTANDDRIRNASIFGAGDYIINIPGFAMTLGRVDSERKVIVDDGVAFINGTEVIIESGTREQVTLSSCSAGESRIDLVGFTYSKDSSGVENVVLSVVNGTATRGNPVEPSYSKKSIINGDSTYFAPLVKVTVSGTSITKFERVIDVVQPVADVIPAGASTEKVSYTISFDSAAVANNGNLYVVNFHKKTGDEYPTRVDATIDELRNAVNNALIDYNGQFFVGWSSHDGYNWCRFAEISGDIIKLYEVKADGSNQFALFTIGLGGSSVRYIKRETVNGSTRFYWKDSSATVTFAELNRVLKSGVLVVYATDGYGYYYPFNQYEEEFIDFVRLNIVGGTVDVIRFTDDNNVNNYSKQLQFK